MSQLFRWPKYWSFSFSPSNEYSGLISFRIDCFDLLIVQGTLKSLPRNHNWKAESISSLVLSLLYGPVQFISAAQSCLTLCDPMDCSTPGLPVQHRLPEHTQSHVHRVTDAIHPSVAPFSSCPQSFPASGSFPVSQLFISGGQSIGASVSVLPMNIQG